MKTSNSLSSHTRDDAIEGIRLWSRVKDDALLEYAIKSIEELGLTYEEVRRIRMNWKALSPTEDESTEEYEIFEKLEELTHDWEEGMYYKYGQEEEDVDES